MSNILIKSFKIENTSLIFLSLTPISFITGSFLANIFTLLLFLICILSQQKNIFFNFIKKYQYIILLLLSLTCLNIIFSETKVYSLTKSLAYYRFFIFSISIVILLNLCKKNISLYSKIFLGLIIFLIIDAYFQLYFGFDIFGFPFNYDYNRVTGPFGDEMIIGNYLLYFGFLSVALINYFHKINLVYNFLLFSIIVLTVLISGERTPFISLVYFFSFVFFLSNKKKFIFFTSICLIILSSLIINSSESLSTKYSITSIPKLADIDSKTVRPKAIDKPKNGDKDIKNNKEDNFFYELNLSFRSNHYVGHYSRAIDILKKNYILGTGFKSYRKICGVYETLKQPSQYGTDEKRRLTCSIHPHNYLLEILSDTGIVGYLTFLSFFIYICFLFFK